MKKNTLKGKIKVLSYMIAFIFMVGVHLMMDRVGAKNENTVVDQKLKKGSARIDNGIAEAYTLLSDSLIVVGENKKRKDTLKAEYSN